MRPTARALLVLGLVTGSWIAGPSARGEADPAEPEAQSTGRELFARRWTPHDPRAHNGDGLGPVFNARSCLDCHHQGGPGGAAGAERNIDIAGVVTNRAAGSGGGFYAFAISFGAGRSESRFVSPPTNPAADALDIAELARIHPGFRESRNLVLHRSGTDPAYPLWRDQVPGRREGFAIRLTQRNPTPLFGAGLIDTISDEVLIAAARRRAPGWPQVKGRVARLPDGRIGRFGWKAQRATLGEFVLAAAATEIGLEVPGHHQAADPRSPDAEPPGLDLSAGECKALVEYVRALPRPVVREPAGPRESLHGKAGRSLFRSIGCAACHLPNLGPIEGIYSDLLLHDMSPQLADTGSYGVLLARAAAEAPGPPPARIPGPHRGAGGATEQEWRTPPLWGLRDSAPYLHDGRAATIEEAITLHGGQAAPSAARYAQLPARDRLQLETFLLSLSAPPAR